MSINHLHFHALWRQCKSKITAYLPGYPALLWGLLKQLLQMTGALFKAYDALHMKI